MVTEGGEIENSKRDERNQPGIDEHSEHEALVHDGEHLPSLTDKSEPLGPGRDESGGRSVHRPVGESLVLPECLTGSGASGSVFAISTLFVIGFEATSAGLSTDFFCFALERSASRAPSFEAGLFADFGCFANLSDFNWAAARPGLSANFD